MTEKSQRASEWLFGDEIKPPVNGSPSELKQWHEASQGKFQEPEEFLSKMSQTSQQAEGWSEAAKDDFRRHIAAIRGILSQSGPPPPEPEWETCPGGRMRLMFFNAFALGWAWAAAEAEFGVNGTRIAREKRAEPLRRAGGERSNSASARRREQLTRFIAERLGDGQLYKNAVSDAADHFGMPTGTIRRLCPKKNFSSHSS